VQEVKGIWLPDDEVHFVKMVKEGPEFAGKGTYQLRKIEAVIPYVRNFRHAVDVGAHSGMWARVLLHYFSKLTAFEPMPAHIECFFRNVVMGDHVKLHEVALGDKTGMVTFHTARGSTGNTRVQDDGERTAQPYAKEAVIFENPGEAMMMRLDDCVLVDPVVDLIKVDCEGYEYFVLKGGEETIKRTHPVIIVEQKVGKGAQYGIDDLAACTLLESWGMKRKKVISGDYIYTWK
jgi:FkbM family methyltransferase